MYYVTVTGATDKPVRPYNNEKPVIQNVAIVQIDMLETKPEGTQCRHTGF